MPGMDGYGLLNVIRSSGVPGTDTVPVIALSASVENENTHYLEVGFTGFLNKPFTAKQLIALLNNLLQADIQAEVSPEFNFDSLTAFAAKTKKLPLPYPDFCRGDEQERFVATTSFGEDRPCTG